MERQTKGAWIIHHGQKVKGDTNGAAEFSALDTAAKAGSFFAQLARSQDARFSKDTINAYAAASGLNPRLEVDAILALLKEQKLLDTSQSEVVVYGATTRGALNAAAEIFDDLDPSPEEQASLTLAEITSNSPQSAKEVTEYIGDNHKLTANRTFDFLRRSELIGFVDAESSDEDKLYFNGNLFREAGPTKVSKVLSTLNADERTRLVDFSGQLQSQGCITLVKATKTLGDTLLSKLRAIGLVDVSFVENESGSTGFVTKPDAFHKFVSPLVDDAFDLAKALVAALSYGMLRSPASRGQIWGIDLLLKKLINGGTVGPATAIGQDYKYLEHRGVVEVFPDGGLFRMRLLKSDIGQIALQVLTQGTAVTAQVLDNVPGSPMAGFKTPETSRTMFRKEERGRLKRTDQDILQVLRTKGSLR